MFAWSEDAVHLPQVRPDMLDLRVPVWVSDIAFLEDSRRVATCHRHSAVSYEWPLPGYPTYYGR